MCLACCAVCGSTGVSLIAEKGKSKWMDFNKKNGVYCKIFFQEGLETCMFFADLDGECINCFFVIILAGKRHYHGTNMARTVDKSGGAAWLCVQSAT